MHPGSFETVGQFLQITSTASHVMSHCIYEVGLNMHTHEGTECEGGQDWLVKKTNKLESNASV